MLISTISHHFRFKVDQTGFDARRDIYGLFVQFDQDVDVSLSKLEVGLKTLATRFGGIIGVGKELLWVIILFFTSCGSFLAFFKQIFPIFQ